MNRGAPEACEQKQDRDYQQAVNLAFAELRIGGHGVALSINESCPGQCCSRSRSAVPGMVP
jgi:2-oxoglutarate dehydrogenase complex dehydrogenase (E1) component-like enzyme